MSGYLNKLLLKVQRDKKNNWFHFGKRNYRLQLCGDSRKDGFFLTQFAEKLEKKGEISPNFMADFTRILYAMEQDNNQPIFTLYELPEVIRGKIG